MEQAQAGVFCGDVAGATTPEADQPDAVGVGFGGTAQLGSRYRRLQRFFSTVRFDYDGLASLIMGLFEFYGQAYYLTLDRANWRWGQVELNILFLAVVYQGTTIPVYGLVLNKRGNSFAGRITSVSGNITWSNRYALNPMNVLSKVCFAMALMS